jgi:hypothetical protein
MGVEEGSIEESVEGKDVSDMVGLVERFASVWVGCNIEAGWLGWLIGEFGMRWMNWY